MKKIVNVALALVLVLAMTVSVFAAVPSVTQEGAKLDRIMVYNKDNFLMTFPLADIIITPYPQAMSKAGFPAAYEELQKGDFTDLIPGLTESLPAGVANEDLFLSQAYDVSASDRLKKAIAGGGYAIVRVNISSTLNGDFVRVVHKGVNGWEVLPAEVSNGYVSFVMSDFSPVAFISLSNVVVSSNGTKSPATGDVLPAVGVAREWSLMIK